MLKVASLHLRKSYSQQALTKCLLLAACSVSGLPVHAQWQVLSQTPQAQHFYDDATHSQGQQISVWRLTDFTQPLTNLEGKEVLSEKTLATIDGSADKIAYSQVTRYSGLQAQGEVRNHYDTPLRFTRVAPDTADALLVHKLCPKK